MLGCRSATLKRRYQSKPVTDCLAWLNRKRLSVGGSANTIGARELRWIPILRWNGQVRWKSFRQPFEPIHPRIRYGHSVPARTNRLSQRESGTEGNVQNCDELLHPPTSPENCSTQASPCGSSHARTTILSGAIL